MEDKLVGMELIALICALIGLVLSLVGAVWLWFGLDPDKEKYKNEGQLHPGEQQSITLPKYISDSRKPTLLVAIGGGVQVIAGILAVARLFT